MSPDRTPDGRFIVVGGRRWRAEDPDLWWEQDTEARTRRWTAALADLDADRR